MAEFLNKNNKGFTLVEMLVTVTIFSIVISISFGLFVSAIWLQKKGLDYQRLLDQTSYAVEYMSRSLRMAGKTPGCASENNYEATSNSIEFFNSNADNGNGECWKFYLSDDVLRVREGTKDYPLTSADLIVNNFNVLLDPSSGQPRVTVFLDIEGKQSHFYSAPRIKIQTTVSQRNLNK